MSATIVYFVTGSLNKDGSYYFPPFMRSQIEAMEKEHKKVIVAILLNNSSPKAVMQNIREWKKKIKTLGKCIVHAQYGSVTALTAALSKGKNPLVISFCGDDMLGTKQTGWKWAIRSRLMVGISHLSTLWANHLIAKSKNIYNRMFSFQQSMCDIIPNGVDLDTFTPVDQNEARKQLNWSSNDFIVLFNPSSGNNAYVKNKPLADEAISLLQQEVPQTKLMLIENKTYKEINLMMHAADALLVTSLHEGSPNIVKEAMACNLPVVTVNCGDVAERLNGVNNSFVSKEYSAPNLTSALLQVHHTGQRSNGREQLLAQQIDNNAVIQKIKNIYNRLS